MADRGGRRRVRTAPAAVMILSAAVVLAGCGGGSPKGSAASTTTPPAPPSTPSTTSSGAASPTLTVTPNTGLKSPATVRLAASGFTPGETLVVIECANKGTSTGPGDCNLSALKPVSADSSGGVKTTYTVVKGPFGSSHIVCSAPNSCLVSVTQESPTPSQEATATISFG